VLVLADFLPLRGPAAAIFIVAWMGCIVAVSRIAERKGRNAHLWACYAIILPVVALPHALLMRPDYAALRAREILDADSYLGREGPQVRRGATKPPRKQP
jgi:hypothetical protein